MLVDFIKSLRLELAELSEFELQSFFSVCFFLIFPICVWQYKVRAYIQMKSLKACKREIKSVMNTAGNVSYY